MPPSIITYRTKGDLTKTETFLKRLMKQDLKSILNKYGQLGVEALSKATPVDTGKTAASWDYEVTIAPGSATLTWTNSNTNQGIPIALLIQYGHGTPTGGYVPGQDYIKPAIRPIMDELTKALWKEVSEL
jgi:hypothetical protein